MNQIQITKQVEDLTLADKMHVIADTLRNCTDIKQGAGHYYNPRDDKFCAMGALAFKAGIPKAELGKHNHHFGLSGALDLYGIDSDIRHSVPLKITDEEDEK